jgi:hypothetical protein
MITPSDCTPYLSEVAPYAPLIWDLDIAEAGNLISAIIAIHF